MRVFIIFPLAASLAACASARTPQSRAVGNIATGSVMVGAGLGLAAGGALGATMGGSLEAGGGVIAVNAVLGIAGLVLAVAGGSVRSGGTKALDEIGLGPAAPQSYTFGAETGVDQDEREHPVETTTSSTASPRRSPLAPQQPARSRPPSSRPPLRAPEQGSP